MAEKKYYFSNPFCFWPEYRRYLYQLITTILLALGVILSAIFILFEVPILEKISVITFFFLLFVLVKKNYPDRYLNEATLKKEKINVNDFFSPALKTIIIQSSKIAKKYQLPPSFALFLSLLETKPISFLLTEELNIQKEELKKIQEEIIQIGHQDNQNNDVSLLDLLNQISQDLVEKAKKLRLNFINEGIILIVLIESFSQLEEILKIRKIEKDDLEILVETQSFAKNTKIVVLKGLSAFQKDILREKEQIKVNPSLTSRPTPLLDKYGVDFTELALFLKIGVMIGHNQEYSNLVNILCREGKRNALLVGPEEIGKETIVSYLAYNIIRDKVPKELRNNRLVSLSLSSLMSGKKDFLNLANLLKQIVEEVLVNRDIILYLKDFYQFKSLAQESGFSMLDAFLPIFDSPWIKIIADSPTKEYQQYLEQDSLIKGNFSVIPVKEVSQREAIEILVFRSFEWERKNKISIQYRAIKRAVILAKRFFDEPLPSAAEHLLTEVIMGVKNEGKTVLVEEDIMNLVTEKTEIPLEITSEEEKDKLLNLEELIHQFIVNQEEAVKTVASYLRQYRAGLTEGKKPIGVFLFVGPTGVGKTELAKTLAKIYFGNEKLMIRFDMSEYQEAKSIFRFIGDPERETQGELTEAVRKKPYSLILLDEFEKAHFKVLDLFLQVFDEGRLTDNYGQTIDFTNTIIIATSNARSDYLKDQLEKNTDFEIIKENFKKALLDYFKPELLNRFDEIVIFQPLNHQHLVEIAKIKLQQFKEQVFENQGLKIEFEEAVYEKLAQLGYNQLLGARPLNSVIRRFIKDPLANLILSEKVESLKPIQFYVENEAIRIKYLVS